MIRTKKDAIEQCAAYKIPDYMADGVADYLLHGVEPGGFLTSVLSNDFMGAAGRADRMNAAALASWARLIYNEFPGSSHGSPSKVTKWLESYSARSGAREASR